jgi:hypothetical protein
MTIRKFETGKTYTARSACDHNCIYSFTIVSRTAKTITVDGMYGVQRRGVKLDWRGEAETCLPFGSYSMAPLITA